MRKNTLTEPQDFRHFARIQPVVRVAVVHPELQNAALLLSNRAAAVDEVLRDVPDLRQVEVGRDLIAVGQNKLREFAWLRLQNRLQLIQFHAQVYSYVGI